ncbi:MBL fold metallo-hydrolase [Geminicoccaceae bacterium 1502E]|nr:MBL fold metallo-hydrolase [Geminicoccaceae bacterium 1502E]
MRVTVLGCGTSAGVPQIGCGCAVCVSPDPRNKRRRCSILVEAQGRKVLFDTGPDLRQQCLDASIGTIDALIYTHAHADHVHGLDDLRAINNNMMAPIPTYAHGTVLERIRSRFPYAFEGGRSEHGFWRPHLEAHAVDGPFRIGGLEVLPFAQKHGHGESWGFRIDGFAYSTDADALDERAFDILSGTEIWIVDALRDRPHPSHAHLDRALGWIERVAPRRAFLTHMNHEVDYADWASRLPAGVLPAFDGLVIEMAE